MGGYFTIRCRPSNPCRGLQLKWMGVFLAIWSALAPSAVPAGRTPSVCQAVPSKDRAAGSLVYPIVATDVALSGRGVLQGVVVANPSDSNSGKAVAGLRIALLREGKVVAQTKSDQTGRFAISHLTGGKYVIAIRCQDGVVWSLHRVWAPGTAPPYASAVARVVPGEGIVLGQGPLPPVSFSEAALIAGLVVGAVAAPILYHNAQQSNRVPASP